MESHRSSRTLSPGQHAIPSVEDSPGMEADEAEPGLSIIGYCLKTQQQADISAPVAGTGRTLRFRGSFLLNIGKMFPCSDVCVHRIGDPVESDFEVKGTVLYGMRSVFDAQPIYRITLSKCDIANENGILWNLQDSGHGFTADDYCNLLELGKDYLGDLMMLAINMRGMRCWKIIRQIPGKLYSFEECVDLLEVPEWCRHELDGFGSRIWSRREGFQNVWIGNNLELEHVSKKIRFIMSL